MNEMVKIQHQQWARDLDDQRRSGLTQREWCRIHGISIHTFEYRCVFCKCKFLKFADKNGEFCISVLEKVAGCPAGLPDAS